MNHTISSTTLKVILSLVGSKKILGLPSKSQHTDVLGQINIVLNSLYRNGQYNTFDLRETIELCLPIFRESIVESLLDLNPEEFSSNPPNVIRSGDFRVLCNLVGKFERGENVFPADSWEEEILFPILSKLVNSTTVSFEEQLEVYMENLLEEESTLIRSA
jgi:hypothetical protein